MHLDKLQQTKNNIFLLPYGSFGAYTFSIVSVSDPLYLSTPLWEFLYVSIDDVERHILSYFCFLLPYGSFSSTYGRVEDINAIHIYFLLPYGSFGWF